MDEPVINKPLETPTEIKPLDASIPTAAPVLENEKKGIPSFVWIILVLVIIFPLSAFAYLYFTGGLNEIFGDKKEVVEVEEENEEQEEEEKPVDYTEIGNLSTDGWNKFLNKDLVVSLDYPSTYIKQVSEESVDIMKNESIGVHFRYDKDGAQDPTGREPIAERNGTIEIEGKEYLVRAYVSTEISDEHQFLIRIDKYSLIEVYYIAGADFSATEEDIATLWTIVKSIKRAGLVFEEEEEEVVEEPETSATLPGIGSTVTIGDYTIDLYDEYVLRNDVDAFRFDQAASQELEMMYSLGEDPDGVTDYYEIGTVTEGEFSGYKVLFGFNKKSYAFTDPMYLTYVIFEDNGSYVFFNKSESTYGEPYNILEPEVYIKDSTLVEENLSFDTYMHKSEIDNAKVISDRANVYEETDETTFIKSSTLYTGIQTYIMNMDENGYIFTKDEVGFMRAHQIRPAFYSQDGLPSIEWTTPEVSSNTSYYDYISIGGCMGSSIEIADVEESDLTVVGTTSTGDSVYEYSDRTKDAFLKKVYEEDYSSFGLNTYNDIVEDDDAPLTFEETAKYHPVFYWKDLWGRYIKFASRSFVMTGGCAKPVVYLYPEETTEVSVKLEIDGVLTHSYPKYSNGWTVTANSNGDLVDSTGKKYDYLFWEGRFNGEMPELNNGWYVEKSNVESFLNFQLAELGFKEKEKTQFIEYWLPRMMLENGKYVFITFVDESVMDKFAPLTLSVEPDLYKRYFMLYKGVEEKKAVDAPVFEKFGREGFVMFEWGGARID